VVPLLAPGHDDAVVEPCGGEAGRGLVDQDSRVSLKEDALAAGDGQPRGLHRDLGLAAAGGELAEHAAVAAPELGRDGFEQTLLIFA
jgi:hypothetical protein